MWLYSSLPWGLMGIIITIKKFFTQKGRSAIFQKIREDNISFFLIWMLFPMLFFTMSANITETYVLYGFPALGILLALHYKNFAHDTKKLYKNVFLFCALIVPTLGFLGTFYVIKVAHNLKTEKFLIHKYKSTVKNNEPIYFLNNKEFSETYYMNKKINITTMQQLKKIVKDNPSAKYSL